VQVEKVDAKTSEGRGPAISRRGYFLFSEDWDTLDIQKQRVGRNEFGCTDCQITYQTQSIRTGDFGVVIEDKISS